MKLFFLAIIPCFIAVIIILFHEKFKKNNIKKNNTEIKKINNDYEEITSNREMEKKRKEDFPIDYNFYQMSIKENIFYISIAVIVIFIVGYIFYRSYLLSLIITPLAILYPKFKVKDLIKKRKNKLNLQFQEGLYALSSSISAGKSVEMAFKDSMKDLEILYVDPNTYIIKEFQYIIRKLEMNQTVEKALLDFSKRANLDDIDSFVDIFITAKRTGGNMVAIMRNTSDTIGDKIRIKQEIDTMIAQKKLEHKVLSVIPILMIVFLSWSAPDYMWLVFNTNIGRVLMTITVVLLVVAYFISKKIMDIEV